MQELEFVTELKAPRLDLQGLWMLLPDPELFEDVDFETVSADVIVSWSLVPELDLNHVVDLPVPAVHVPLDHFHGSHSPL